MKNILYKNLKPDEMIPGSMIVIAITAILQLILTWTFMEDSIKVVFPVFAWMIITFCVYGVQLTRVDDYEKKKDRARKTFIFIALLSVVNSFFFYDFNGDLDITVKIIHIFFTAMILIALPAPLDF